MKAHAQHQRRQRPESSLPTKSPTRHAGGRQALKDSPGASAEAPAAGLDAPATSGFAHDFSRIPASSRPPVTIQAKLKVNTPGDIYEREADRIADQVTATPAQTAVSGAPSSVQRLSGQSNGQTAAAVPATVDRALASPGSPLEPAVRHDMEQRLGHDFSNVRVHSDAAAEQSAQDLNANAYTVGHDIVFGAGRFAPGTNEGRRLIAHELAHVAQQGTANVVRRDIVRDAAGNLASFEFRIGHELVAAFASKAKTLTADGTLSNTDILALKSEATNARDTVSDHERMFMAGLLDPANVRRLRATRIGPTASIRFPFNTLTSARVRQVIEAGQPVMPADVTEPAGKLLEATDKGDLAEMLTQTRKVEDASEKEILSLVGASFRPQTAAVIAFAKAHNILLFELLSAIQKAASDDTASDRMMAAVAYATAADVGHPLAADLRTGLLRIDALAPARFAALPGVNPTTRALYVAAAPLNPTLAGLKGDTIYMPTNFNIANLGDRSQVIHELRHAEDDKARSPTAEPAYQTQQSLEMAAYKAQARYILDQMSGQTAAAQAVSAREAAATGTLPMLGMLLEAKTDLTKYQPLVEQVFAAATPPVPKAGTVRALGHTNEQIEALMENDIRTGYNITESSTTIIEGQAGESLIHWIRRLP